MIKFILVATSALALPISLLVIFIGKRVLNIYPSVRRLYNDESFFRNIKLTRNAIKENGETLFSFATKTITSEYLIDEKKSGKVDHFVESFKMGQIVNLTYYYYDHRLDKEFRKFKLVCQALLSMTMIILLNAANTLMTGFNLNKLWQSFDSDLIKLFSLGQTVTFLIFMISLISEANKIDRMFDHRS